MRPAPDVSLVAPILALRGVPARMPDVTIRVECNGGKGVTDIIRPEHGPADQCFVVFEELKCVLHLLPALMSACCWPVSGSSRLESAGS